MKEVQRDAWVHLTLWVIARRVGSCWKVVPRKMVQRRATQGQCSGCLNIHFVQYTARQQNPTYPSILENRTISTYQEKEWNRNTPCNPLGVIELPKTIGSIGIVDSTWRGDEPPKNPPASVWGGDEPPKNPPASVWGGDEPPNNPLASIWVGNEPPKDPLASIWGGDEPPKDPPASVWGEEEEPEVPEVLKVSWIKSEGFCSTIGRHGLLDSVSSWERRRSIALFSHAGTG